MNSCAPSAPAALAHLPFFEHIDEAFFFFNPRFQVLYLNSAALELSQKIYGRKPVIGDEILPYISEGRRSDFKKTLNQVLEGKTVRYDIKVEAKDLWLSCKYFPCRDEGGAINGVYGLLKDISTSKIAERTEEAGAVTKELFESRLLLEQFMQNSPLVSWITDAKGVMQYMSPNLLKTFGLTEQDLGKTVFELFDAQLAMDYFMNNQKVIRHGKPIETIEKAISADGQVQVLKNTKFPLVVQGEVMVGGWAVDVTGQVELQDKLIKTVERQEYVNEATSDAIYDWDFAGKRIYRSPAYEALFGCPQKDVTIKTKLRLIHPGDFEHYKQNAFTTLRNPASDRWKIEYRLRDVSGNYRTIVDKAFIIRSENKVVRVIGAMQDITSQKQLQQKLVEQEKRNKQKVVKSIIEAQEKERRQLSVELHDNVNQMLASCKLMLETALENTGHAKMLTERTYQSIQTVIDEIRRISHDLNPSAIADLGLVEAIEQSIERINISGKINIRFNPDRLAYTHYLNEEDKITIFRIVQEQLNNILKHSKATSVLIELSMADETIKLCIRDNGVGFDPTTCKKGLGLRNIYNRVNYYGGDILIDTGIGKGVKLCIAFNASRPFAKQRHLKIA